MFTRCVPALVVMALSLLPQTAQAQACQWSDIFPESGVSGLVYALEVFDGELYVAGNFTGTIETVSVQRIAKWDGTSWDNLAGGMSAAVSALCVFDNGSGPALYAGGSFLNAGGTSAKRVAKWNPGASYWSSLAGDGPEDEVYSLAVYDSDGDGGAQPALYVGGRFDQIGGTSAYKIAIWSGSQWSPMPNNYWIDAGVHALVSFDHDGSGGDPPMLYAAGAFTQIGTSARRMAKWNPSTESWTRLGTLGYNGVNAQAEDMLVFNDGSGDAVFVGGHFDVAGPLSNVGHIAKWDGFVWHSVDQGVNDTVYALRVIDADGGGPDDEALYVGGAFTTASGITAPQVAKWNGSSWSALGSGPGSTVRALAGAEQAVGSLPGPTIYAGGGAIVGGPAVAWWNCDVQPVPGDLDNDGDVDIDDFEVFANCMAGPDITTPPGGCTPEQFDRADLDSDGDVDLDDFAEFQLIYPA